MIAALVPVKRLGAGKSRLESALGRRATERLTLAMLADVLAALRAVPRLRPVAVVTPDETVAEAACNAGARSLVGPDPGLNASLERAAAELISRDHPGLLVVLGDVPGVRPAELDSLLDATEELGRPCVALAPSSDGGTSALVRVPHDTIPPRFGAGSAARHREEAKRAGVPYREVQLASLALDLDSQDDLRAFLAGPGNGARTRSLLRELGFEGSA
jgi:2-phospho-L-lactate guanylyltransferase